MDVLISKEDSIERVVTALDFVGSRDTDCAVKAIEDAPQVPCLPRVESYWIKLIEINGSLYSSKYKCSHCGAVVVLGCAELECDYKFCPYCASLLKDASTERHN